MTVPVATWSAADREVVPWRRSSWLRRSTWPGCFGKSGCERSSAWIWLFSSTHRARARWGGARQNPDDVTRLLHKERIGRQLEYLTPMRLQAEGLPDAMDGGWCVVGGCGHLAQRPMRRVGRLCLQRAADEIGDLFIANPPPPQEQSAPGAPAPGPCPAPEPTAPVPSAATALAV